MLFFKYLFNVIFSENFKNKIRKSFEGAFAILDKLIMYKAYVKACKYVIKKIIMNYDNKNYGWHQDPILTNFKYQYIYTKVLNGQFTIRDDEMRECINDMKKNGIDVYGGALRGVDIYSEEQVGYDEQEKLYYGYYEGKRLYFNENISSLASALKELNSLAAEQTENSPHRYLSETFKVEDGDIVFDIGCADGNFSLSIIDKVEKVYLFEADEKWLRPLQLTFEPYKNKVEIVKKYVSDNNNSNEIMLDSFCRENNMKKIDMIKMDVEGYEEKVLKGASDLIQNRRIRKIAACTYHRDNDEIIIKDMLEGYNTEFTRGYMLGAMLEEIYNVKPPYFRKALIRAWLKEKNSNEETCYVNV